jgi:hypothetical protein
MRTPLEQRVYNTHRFIRQVIHNPANATHQTWIRNGIPREEDVGTFRDFYRWVVTKLGPPPAADSRILRKDQSRGYLRANLEWGTHKTQGDRLLRAHRIRYRGKTQCLKQWAQELGLSKDRVYQRYWRGETSPRRLFRATP